MRNYRLHMIRHGLTQANKEGRYVGRTDSPLCPQGKELLAQFKEDCEYPWAQVVYSSPLTRCLETADILYPDAPITVVDNLIELDMGDFEGRTFSDLKNDVAFANWMKDGISNPPPNGEDAQGFLLRIVEALQFIFEDMMTQGIFDSAVLTHGGVMMSLLSAVGLPKAPMEQWQCGNGAGFTLLMTPQMWMRDHAAEVYEAIPKGIEGKDIKWMLQGFFEEGTQGAPSERIEKGENNEC